MPNRVRLTWNRNQDAETQYYRIFRSDSPDITQQNNSDMLVMRVDQPKSVNPITITNETLVRESSKSYALAHKTILLQNTGTNFPFLVTVDGTEVSDYVLDTQDGKVIFDNDISQSSVVIAQIYTFDGVQVWDYEKTENGKIYYGPEAKDTSAPNPPMDISIQSDTANNRVTLSWSTATVNGKKVYYKMDAAIDESNYSKLTPLRHGFLQEPLADRPYVIERSDDGVKWTEIAKVKENQFYEYFVDRQAPYPITGLTLSAAPYANSGKAQVTLDWDLLRDTPTTRTSTYRIRSVNRLGVVSVPSDVAGPIPFKVALDYILIRRKVFDGTLPTFDGSDATTVGKITNLSLVQWFEDVPDNQRYIYGLWVVDKSGNQSVITYGDIEISDATPPDAPLNLTTEPFHVVLG